MKVYVVPTLTGWRVIKDGHRSGREYTTPQGAGRAAKTIIRHEGRYQGRILWMDGKGKVAREVRIP